MSNIIKLSKEAVYETFDHTFTKKEAQKIGLQITDEILNNGEIDVIRAAAYLARMAEIVNTAFDAIKNHLPAEKTSINGVEFTPTNGRKMPEYDADLIYKNLKEKLKSRETLLKAAITSKELIFDSEGVELPQVPVKYSKDSITIKF